MAVFFTLSGEKGQKMKKNLTRKLTESAIMIALATILSLIPIVNMPYGGSITAVSMLPIVVIAFRHGTGWGTLTALAYSLIQMLFGLNNLAYATSPLAAVAIIMLDYILAFTVMGLSGIFSKVIGDRAISISLGTFFTCALRYVCHVISGCTVWAGVSIPTQAGLYYSLSYNSAYMIPETILTVVGVYALSTAFDLKSHPIKRANYNDRLGLLGIFSIAVGVMINALTVFFSIQNADGYDITNIKNANWTLVLIVTAVTVLLTVISILLQKRKNLVNK